MAPRKRNRNTSAVRKSEDLRMDAKKQTYLADFDKQISTKRQQIQRDGDILIRAVDRLFATELCKLPKEVRSMQLPIFMATGGKEEALAHLEVDEEMANELAAVKKIKAQEHQKTFGPSTKKTSTLRTTQKRTANTSVLRSAVEQTPGGDMANQSCAWPTPSITPKFDPRLPLSKETNFRKPRPGEKLTSMRGSLVVPNESSSSANRDNHGVSMLVSLNDGNAFQLDETTRLLQNSYPSVSSLDELKKLEAIKDQLATIIRYNKINLSSVKK